MLTQLWRNNYDRAFSRKRTPRPEIKGHRLAHCLNLFYRGFISRGLGVNEGFVKLPADIPAVFAQVLGKHPPGGRHWKMVVATSQT